MNQNLREISGNSSRSLFINPEAPFDFEKSASMHGRFQKSLPDLYEDGAYKRVLHVHGKPVLVIVSSNGSIKRPRLKVEVHPRLSILETKPLRNLLHNMFGSSFDFKSFRKAAKKDRLMNAVSRELVGLRPIRPPTIFEALVIGITEQQISLDAAIAIRSRLIEKYGDLVRFRGRDFFAFPTPTSLAVSDPIEMRTVGVSRSKVLYIRELARRVEIGELDLERLRMMDDESAVEELTKIKGIGRWTAEYALIRGMGRVNSLAADDLGIQRAVSQAYFKGKKTGAKQVRQVLGKFAPYSGISAFYLMYYLFWEQKDAQ